MKHSSTFNLFGKLKETVSDNISNYFVNDEPLGDIADRANALVETYRAQALQAALSLRTQQIKRGRRRRRCEQCRKPIPEERLAILPRTRRCVSCQKCVEQSSHKGQQAGKMYLR